MGEFDTISDHNAVERVGDWRWYGGIASSWYPWLSSDSSKENSPAVSEGEPTPGANSEATSSPESPVDVTATSEPRSGGDDSVTPQPERTPEKVTVVLNKSVRALLTIVDKSGTTWLVPGYIFFDKDGSVYPVLSVVPGVIELPEPMWMLR
jgi:hypothetical protein